MMSMQDMFYGEAEPVWIVKPEKEGDKKKGENNSGGGSGGNKKEVDNSILASIPYYPYYYPDYIPTPAKKEGSKGGDKKETEVVMKVPICCGECVEQIEVALSQMKGIKSVECNIRRERVKVVATTAAPGDILMAVRAPFKKSTMWSDDD